MYQDDGPSRKKLKGKSTEMNTLVSVPAAAPKTPFPGSSPRANTSPRLNNSSPRPNTSPISRSNTENSDPPHHTSPRARSNTEYSEAGVGHRPPSLFKRKLRFLIKNYITIILYVIIIGPIIPFVCILVRSALRPGLLYCTPTRCPGDLQSVVPDLAMLLIGLVLYVLFSAGCLLILLSSGSWMHNAFRNKVYAIASLYIMFWSVIQLVAPAAQRAYVVPYSVIENYSFTIAQTSEKSANFSAAEFYSIYYRNEDMHVALRVYAVDNRDVTPHNLDPSNILVYSDNWADTSEVRPGDIIGRSVDNLQNNTLYIWLLFPAKKGGKGAYLSNSFLAAIDNDGILHNIYNGNLINSKTYVDLRGYIVCLWDENLGCR